MGQYGDALFMCSKSYSPNLHPAQLHLKAQVCSLKARPKTPKMWAKFHCQFIVNNLIEQHSSSTTLMICIDMLALHGFTTYTNKSCTKTRMMSYDLGFTVHVRVFVGFKKATPPGSKGPPGAA